MRKVRSTRNALGRRETRERETDRKQRCCAEDLGSTRIFGGSRFLPVPEKLPESNHLVSDWLKLHNAVTSFGISTKILYYFYLD